MGRDGSVLLTLIDRAVCDSSAHVAVSGPDDQLTYGELADRAERLAHRLRQAGAEPGGLVGLCIDRSAGLVVAALAILKAECAYVAIDPAYPDERKRWMLEDSSASLVIVSDTRGAGWVGTGGACSVLEVAAGGREGGGSGPDGGISARSPVLSPDLAYVVYTSGSTGRPKGVMVDHDGLLNLVTWHRERFALGPDDRCSQIASPGFDAAVWEIWPCLASGAALHVVPEDLRADPIGLRDWLVSEGITVSFLPTSVAEGVMGLAWPSGCALRFLLTGGDALRRRPPPGLGFTVVNNYGLSETAVVATSGVVAPDGEGAPSIGQPITGVVAEVVDGQLQPVEPGVAGELLIGGVAVARGYVNQAELTEQRFMDDPRRYRTGDLVRVGPDGDLDFLGRMDDQLSIRGFRVEPGEVDGMLNAHPAIQASVSVGAGTSGADRHLVTYLVAAGSDRPDGEELREFLARYLPDYLVPSRFIWLDQLPLTANGKVDRDALPDRIEAATDEPGNARPRTSTEAAVAPILAVLLDRTEIGMHQNFFLLGGHSMLGAQLIVRLEDMFGVEIGLRYLFDHPTVAEIAAEVERQMALDQADVPVGR